MGFEPFGECDVTPPPPGTTYVGIAADDRCTLAVRSDGEMVAWGVNLYGRFDFPSPPAGLAYTQLSAGSLHVLALRSDGAVLARGYDGQGQIDVPPAPPGKVLVEVSAGSNFSFARWGDPPIPPSVYCTAKTNSLGCVPVIAFSGTPTLHGLDDFVITASNVHNQRSGVMFWVTRLPRCRSVAACCVSADR
jgi:hypothetical protein